MNIIRRILKWTGITLGTVLLLPVFIMVLLYIPPIQNWAVQKAIGIASEETGMDISLERVGITPLLDIELENLTAIQENDTVLHTGAVMVDLDFGNILQGQFGIEGIDIRNGVFNSLDLIPQLGINGRLGLLHLDREDTDLKNGRAQLSGASIEGCDLDICMRDTVITDTTESAPLPWTIKVGQIDIRNSRIGFRTAGDTLAVSTAIRNAQLSGGDISLENGIYAVNALGIDIDTLLLCMKDTAGASTCISLPATSLSAEGLRMDTMAVSLPKFSINTGMQEKPQSLISGNLHMDFNAFTPQSGGFMAANIKASLSHSDLLGIAKDYIPEDLAKAYPALPLDAHITANGNIDSINIDTLHLLMPTAIDIKADGYVADALAEGGMRAHLLWDASTMNLDFVRRYLGLTGINIPRMNMSADTRVHGNTYKADALIRQGEGTLHANASLDLDNMSYMARAHAKDINIRNFMPEDSIGRLTLYADVSGHGTDFLSKATGDRKSVV